MTVKRDVNYAERQKNLFEDKDKDSNIGTVIENTEVSDLLGYNLEYKLSFINILNAVIF